MTIDEAAVVTRAPVRRKIDAKSLPSETMGVASKKDERGE